MKKLFVILFVALLTICLFAGCGTDNDTKYIKDQTAEIVRCFDEKDIDGLKALFCKNTQDNYNLDKEIKNAFDLYEGTSESFRINLQGCWAGGYSDGILDDKHFTPQIEEITTDENKIYSIGYLLYTVYESDHGRVGIVALALRNGEGEEIAKIGGKWVAGIVGVATFKEN